jgi:hypothetical protein
MPLLAALNKYQSEIKDYSLYITKAFAQDPLGKYFLTAEEQHFVVDSAFLRIFMSWETLLENAFVLYLMGNPSAGGRLPQRFAIPLSESHAREMLIGTQRYVDWANPEIVRRLSQLYFDHGEPIGSMLSSVQADLFDLKTVRNAAAHLTSTTGRALDALATRRLSKTSSAITVSDFLLAIDPSGSGTSTILDYYLSLLNAASDGIVRWI